VPSKKKWKNISDYHKTRTNLTTNSSFRILSAAMKKFLAIIIFGTILQNISYGYIIHNNTVAEIPLEDYYFQTRIGNPLATVKEKTRAL